MVEIKVTPSTSKTGQTYNNFRDNHECRFNNHVIKRIKLICFIIDINILIIFKLIQSKNKKDFWQKIFLKNPKYRGHIYVRLLKGSLIDSIRF